MHRTHFLLHLHGGLEVEDFIALTQYSRSARYFLMNFCEAFRCRRSSRICEYSVTQSSLSLDNRTISPCDSCIGRVSCIDPWVVFGSVDSFNSRKFWLFMCWNFRLIIRTAFIVCVGIFAICILGRFGFWDFAAFVQMSCTTLYTSWCFCAVFAECPYSWHHLHWRMELPFVGGSTETRQWQSLFIIYKMSQFKYTAMCVW